MLYRKEVITVRETLINRTIRTYAGKDDGPSPSSRKGRSPSRKAIDVINNNKRTGRSLVLVGRNANGAAGKE